MQELVPVNKYEVKCPVCEKTEIFNWTGDLPGGEGDYNRSLSQKIAQQLGWLYTYNQTKKSYEVICSDKCLLFRETINASGLANFSKTVANGVPYNAWVGWKANTPSLLRELAELLENPEINSGWKLQKKFLYNYNE